MKTMWIALVLFISLNIVVLSEADHEQLQLECYSKSCRFAEHAIKDEVRRAFMKDAGVAAGLLRLHFHDCFVRGCDGSVLIDSTPTNTAEKDSPPNKNSLRGFEVIDNAKARLEAMCPEVVSCADIVAFAARDSVEMTGGLRYDVQGGRKDGRISTSKDAQQNLPPPTADVNLLTRIFGSKGLTQEEMVILSGAHTISRSHCSSFNNRLYNFSRNSRRDPTLNSAYALPLMRQCPSSNSFVPMDPVSPQRFDEAYYKDILANRAV